MIMLVRRQGYCCSWDIEELLFNKTTGIMNVKTTVRNNGNGSNVDVRVNGNLMYQEGLPLWPKDLEKVENHE